jgi:hypothetical protein
LTGADITSYRGVIARCNYLASDRPDCNFAIKEGCREMSAPTTGSLRRLVRIGRYLKNHPRLVWKFPMQSQQSEVIVRTDADWAGCRRARKSTSGGSISIGEHCIKTWSKTQAVIAKSSAESELYGVVRGACEGLGIKTLCADMGSEIGITLELDATAAKGILDRQGIAKVRHIDVNCLWLQEQCAKKMVPLTKIPGEGNSADLMTKHLSIHMILRHMMKLNLEHVGGRSEAAAKLHTLVEAPRTTARSVTFVDTISKKSLSDYWSERGEQGRWVRVHVDPRAVRFDPWRAPRGPGRKTKLKNIRITQGVYENGDNFQKTDDWQIDGHHDIPHGEHGRSVSHLWTGRTIFLVDRQYSKEYGTDQRRQRATTANRINHKTATDGVNPSSKQDFPIELDYDTSSV